MIKINLLPVKQTKKRGVGQQQLLLFAILLIGLGLALFVVKNEQRAKIDKLDKEKVSVQSEIERMKDLIGNIEVVQKKRDDLKKKLDVIEVLKRGKSGPVRVLDEISTIIPKKVWLKSLKEGEGKLTFDGEALDNKDIALFMKNLEGSKFFKKVTLISVQRNPLQKKEELVLATAVMAFQIVCDYSVPPQS